MKHVREMVQKALERVGAIIDNDLMEGLVRSMQKWVETVIKAKGWYTRY